MANGFHNVRFPEDISNGATGGPGFKTDIVEFSSGKEQRNVKWSQSRMAWDVAHSIRTGDEMNRLVSFFRNRKGRAYGFRFKDWTDYQCEMRQFATGDGETYIFQLEKWYNDEGTFDGTFERRKITRPVEGSLSIRINGIATVAFTCDYNTGLVTFADPPDDGAVIAAEFEFDVPCRFDTDQMKYTYEAYDIYTWGQILVVEIKE